MQHVAHNHLARCCIEMLRAFDRALKARLDKIKVSTVDREFSEIRGYR